MKFDYTYITVFGFKVFEPMVIVTNVIFLVLSIIYFLKLNKLKNAYSKQMGLFMLFLGISMAFGAAGHAVHLQLGQTFFDIILFLMNAFSLLSIYFCFRGPYTYLNAGKPQPKIYIYLVRTWVLILLAICAIKGDFLLIKIHGGLVLIFSLIAHYIAYKRTGERGSLTVVTGVLISFLPIISHSLKLSFGEWFNHKDIAHVFMIISLIVIYKGAYKVSENFPEEIRKPVNA